MPYPQWRLAHLQHSFCTLRLLFSHSLRLSPHLYVSLYVFLAGFFQFFHPVWYCVVSITVATNNDKQYKWYIPSAEWLLSLQVQKHPWLPGKYPGFLLGVGCYLEGIWHTPIEDIRHYDPEYRLWYEPSAKCLVEWYTNITYNIEWKHICKEGMMGRNRSQIKESHTLVPAGWQIHLGEFTHSQMGISPFMKN